MALKNLFEKKEVKKPAVVEEPKVVNKSTEVAGKQKANLKVPIDTLLEKCRKAVREEFAKDHHEEAFEILQLTTEEVRKEFLKYHEEDKGNVCGMVLDKAKRDLIAQGKIIHKDEHAFGHPFML